jgi:hypothetical protein
VLKAYSRLKCVALRLWQNVKFKSHILVTETANVTKFSTLLEFHYSRLTFSFQLTYIKQTMRKEITTLFWYIVYVRQN